MDDYEKEYYKLIDYVGELIDILIETYHKSDSKGHNIEEKKQYFRNVWKYTECKYHINKMIKHNNFLNNFKKYVIQHENEVYQHAIREKQKLLTDIVNILNIMHTEKLNMKQLSDFVHVHIKNKNEASYKNIIDELESIKVPTTKLVKNKKAINN